MADDKCAFNDPILHGGFGCRNASPVARRAGPDIACGSPADQTRCQVLLERMRAAGLPALGYEDDLLSMPHSVLMKVKFGGLVGLSRLLEGGSSDTVIDIAGLIDSACQRFGDVQAIPMEPLVEAMKAHFLRRRSARSS